MSRIRTRFDLLKKNKHSALITFLTAGDPDPATSLQIIESLPAAGSDIIEIGMPFSDPMADGPAIQGASQRALKAGMTLRGTLDLVRSFRQQDQDTPIVLMGYYNPIFRYGNEGFISDALSAGVDGLIIVDLPPEEDEELCIPAVAAGLDWIRLTTPTTDSKRLPTVLQRSGGFIYHVAIAGITGTGSAAYDQVESALSAIREHSNLPLAVGFGIKTANDVRQVTSFANAAVVGSAIVDIIHKNLDDNDKPTAQLVERVVAFVQELAQGKQ